MYTNSASGFHYLKMRTGREGHVDHQVLRQDVLESFALILTDLLEHELRYVIVLLASGSFGHD